MWVELKEKNALNISSNVFLGKVCYFEGSTEHILRLKTPNGTSISNQELIKTKQMNINDGRWNTKNDFQKECNFLRGMCYGITSTKHWVENAKTNRQIN